MRVAKEGLRFIVPASGLGAVFGFVGLGGLAALFFLLAAALVFFFRDPNRVPPAGEHLLVSPADGEVLGIEPADTPGRGVPATKLTIFLALYNVHLVRAPFAATVASADYHPGKFLPAYKPEAGTHNESRTLVLKGGPTEAVLKMIVGVAARRIKCFVRAGEAVERGQKIGLMFFGSRVELTLPRGAVIKVGLHDRVKAGETIVAEVQP